MSRKGIIIAVLVVVLGVFFATRKPSLMVEMIEVNTQTVFEYIVEDAKTRLDNEYIIDMPIPGTSVDVRIITAKSEGALAVPDRALFRNEGAWALFVVNDDVAHLVNVEVGLRNDDWAEIISGIEAGAVIVSELKNDLIDGIKVSRLN